MEIDVEKHRAPAGTASNVSAASFELRLLGRMALRRDGDDVPLPPSRKVRALIAYLALAPRPVARGRLCELLFDAPSDPRGELRWCLSRMRSVLDDDVRRVRTDGESVSLVLDGCAVDTARLAEAFGPGIETLSTASLRALESLFTGELLEGFVLERQPAFDGWLVAQRRRFRAMHVALLRQLARATTHDETIRYLERWLDLTPLDTEPHVLLLETLARGGRLREGEEHLAAATRLFQSEGCPLAPLREAWRAARARPVIAVESTAKPSTPIALPSPEVQPSASAQRASIAVMPFAGPNGERTLLGDGLAHDATARLARLRSLFVIAPGSAFALRERGVSGVEAGRLLGADYVLTGSVRRDASRLIVDVELADTRTARLAWGERLNQPADAALAVVDELVDSVVASVASQIEAIERNRAMLRPPASLTAWESHHRGLWHLYRFTRDDNARARRWFERAVELDRTFARAHAGLSFTHFQDAFQGWATRGPATERAFVAAAEALVADERDPAAHWAFGRAQWLRGCVDDAVAALNEAVAQSPNFALGHYTLAFVHGQSGDARAALAACDRALRLSPYDPLLFAMLGARAMALLRLDRVEEAAQWAARAAAQPNAHAHVVALAACTLGLAAPPDRAQRQLADLRLRNPGYRRRDLFDAFRFDDHGASLLREGANRIGLH